MTAKKLYIYLLSGSTFWKKLQTQTMAIVSESDGRKHLMSFPPERIGHVAVCEDKYMIVWGGYNVSITYIDTVTRRVLTCWQCCHPRSQGPGIYTLYTVLYVSVVIVVYKLRIFTYLVTLVFFMTAPHSYKIRFILDWHNVYIGLHVFSIGFTYYQVQSASFLKDHMGSSQAYSAFQNLANAYEWEHFFVLQMKPTREHYKWS